MKGCEPDENEKAEVFVYIKVLMKILIVFNENHNDIAGKGNNIKFLRGWIRRTLEG